MNYSIQLSGDDLSLIGLAIQELPEKARLNLLQKINSQIAAQESKLKPEETTKPEKSPSGKAME